jgi:uncharacterized OsmC-like protein
MTQPIQAALRRAEAVFLRRPEAGLHDDAPANARWTEGTRVVVRHNNGARFATDLPVELGGGGQDVTPGWFFRAGVASCAVSSIVLAAAVEGVELTALEIDAGSRSDTRGLLGMVGHDGTPVPAQPEALRLRIRIAARDASPEQLRALTERAIRRSPIPCVVAHAVPLILDVDVDPRG